MWRSVAFSLLTMVLASSAGAAQEGSYQGVYFTIPAGWTSGIQDGRFVFAPTDMTEETAVVVVLYGAEKFGGKSFDDWFRAKMASDLNPKLKVLQQGEVQSSTAGELRLLTTGRTVQDAEGGVRLQMYHGISDGRQAGHAMVVTASEAAINKYADVIGVLLQSLRFTKAPNLATNPPPAGAGNPGVGPAVQGATQPSPPGTKSQIAVSDVVGSWSHSTSSYADYVSRSTGSYAGSSTIAYGQGYTFASDGTYQHVFTGMINSRYVKEKDSGTWGFEDGHLVIRSRERDPKTYQIIGYQTAPDGTTFMTLLDVYYPPSQGNIDLYAEKFARPAKMPAAK
jgi:hypothetical protein